MTLEEEYAILSYLPLSRRANIGANIIANISSARKKTEDRGERRKTETQRIFTLALSQYYGVFNSEIGDNGIFSVF